MFCRSRQRGPLPTLNYHRQPRRRAWVLRRGDTTVEAALEPRLETNEPEVRGGDRGEAAGLRVSQRAIAVAGGAGRLIVVEVPPVVPVWAPSALQGFTGAEPGRACAAINGGFNDLQGAMGWVVHAARRSRRCGPREDLVMTLTLRAVVGAESWTCPLSSTYADLNPARSSRGGFVLASTGGSIPDSAEALRASSPRPPARPCSTYADRPGCSIGSRLTPRR